MIKNILLKLELEGQGIVNYDSNDQKYILNDTHLKNVIKSDNVSYAKKTFYQNDDGKLSFKIKISNDSLKHSMFGQDMISQNPNIVHHDYLLYNYIASPTGFLRGYLFPKKIGDTQKKSSPISLCDAEQTCNAKSAIEVFSRSGEKISNDGTSDKGDTTFYFKETIGKIKYESIGAIDLMK